MSQSISIKEGDQSKAFGHIQRLEIANSGGGTSLWVPEDDVDVKTLSVSENGRYIAETGAFIKYEIVEEIRQGVRYVDRIPVTEYKDDRKCFGYDEISVNIDEYVSGVDENGVPYSVEVDSRKRLVKTELPTSIAITVPAEKLVYVVGEDIDTRGMEVTGYYTDGTIYGILKGWTISPRKASVGTTKVTVSWERKDGKKLATKYDIQIMVQE